MNLVTFLTLLHNAAIRQLLTGVEGNALRAR